MTKHLRDVYTSEVLNELHLHAVWPIGANIELGDYGTLEGNCFVPRGKLKLDFGIAVQDGQSGVPLMFEFKSSGVVAVEGGVRGKGGRGGVRAKATTKVTFKKKDSVLFKSMKLTYHSVANLKDTSAQIMQAFKDKRWDGQFVFVHSVFRSEGGTTVLVSSSDNAAIELQATANVAHFDLADAGALLKATKEKDIGLKIIAEPNLTPLLSLSGVRPRNRWLTFLGFGDKTVEPLMSTLAGTEENHMVPAHVIGNSDVTVSPDVARDMELDVDELYHVVEIGWHAHA
jgi:hypothetical protein